MKMTIAVLAAALLLVPLAVADTRYVAPAPACYAPTVTVYETVTEVQTETETVYNTVVEELVQTETATETETNTETETEFVTETLVETNTEVEQVREGRGRDTQGPRRSFVLVVVVFLKKVVLFHFFSLTFPFLVISFLFQRIKLIEVYK